MSAKDRPTKRPTARKASRARSPIDDPQNELVKRLKRERDDAVELQAASAEVLKIIRSSPGKLKSVFEAMLASALHICEAKFGHILLYDGERFHAGHLHDVPSAYRAFWEQHGPIRPGPNTGLGRLTRTKQVAHIPDLKADPAYAEREPLRVVTVEQAGARTFLSVPMLKENELIGAIVIYRQEVRPFTEKQIDLVQTFADQAVIAIENTRLFNETNEALERQTATADILKAIASSPDDVQPVFDAIAGQSNRLLNGLSTAVYHIVGNVAHLMSYTPISPAADAHLRVSFPIPLAEVMWGKSIRNGEVFRVIDTEDGAVSTRMRDMARNRGWRSAVFVPLLSDRRSIGAISVTRVERGSFADHHVDLLRTFADQAVIAISNVELFQQVQKRTNELTQSLDDLRAAQDRLVQTEKLASLGQLTAGIAHEIKNPLNFVNNFSSLSAELVDELDETLAPASLDQKLRGDVGELIQMLKSNLEKVVQHGKRADSIVKNMLLHSREGSGEHRIASINAIVEDSLNLAYHGARAEKVGFSITLKRDLDPEAGALDVYPQEMTRALLNLISNGFYAATKRKIEVGEATFEPVLSAVTKDLGKAVEIRIRDNGAGIPPEVREKMFNPFFTTKPTGEGTGLGLSITHDIIVKQHGGRIDVETKLGEFTEVIIILPRENRTAAGEEPE